MDALRKVYHRAVQIPIENIERLWSELESFESNLNKITVIIFPRLILKHDPLSTGQHAGKEIHGRSVTIIHASTCCPSSTTTPHCPPFPSPPCVFDITSSVEFASIEDIQRSRKSSCGSLEKLSQMGREQPARA